MKSAPIWCSCTTGVAFGYTQPIGFHRFHPSQNQLKGWFFACSPNPCVSEVCTCAWNCVGNIVAAGCALGLGTPYPGGKVHEPNASRAAPPGVDTPAPGAPPPPDAGCRGGTVNELKGAA